MKVVEIVTTAFTTDSEKGQPTKHKHAETRIIVLGNLHNAAFLAEFPTIQLAVLRSLIKYASEQSKIGAVEAFLARHEAVADSLSKVQIEVQRQVLLDIYDALRKYGNATALEQTYLIRYLTTFDSPNEQKAIDGGVQSLACTAIEASVGNVLAHQGRQIQQLAAVKTLASAGGSKAQVCF